MNNRYDFVYLFDCKDGNPNGDPDAAMIRAVCATRASCEVTMSFRPSSAQNVIAASSSTPRCWNLAVFKKDRG